MASNVAGCGIAPRSHEERVTAAKTLADRFRATLQGERPTVTHRSTIPEMRAATDCEIAVARNLKRALGRDAACTKLRIGRNTLAKVLAREAVRLDVLERLAAA